ncbi:phosphate signaling complex protein PhoU [Hellea sp.]|nr:phosphate signaling complex protein PhoU [Hellea sp.]
MSENHIVASFDNDMSKLESLFQEMGDIVLVQLKDATRALRKEDRDLAKKVVKGDKQLNELERDLNDLAIKILALRQPFAIDLRYVLTTLKSAGHLERMGDLTRNMAQRTRTIAKAEAETGPIETLIRMSKLVQGMTETILEAYKSRDGELAKKVRAQDEKVDMAHNSLFRELVTYMMEDASNISACMHVLFIAKNIERMGDNIADIAKEIIYMTTGDWPEGKRAKSDKTSKIIFS